MSTPPTPPPPSSPLHRRSIRLKNYDYSQAGAYSVTVCAEGGKNYFGKIHGSEMRPNDCGELVASTWQALPNRFENFELDEFVVMPNHFHGIAVFLERKQTPDDLRKGGNYKGVMLGEVMRAFKSISAMQINRLLNRSGSLWQRSYHEHVVRSEESLNRIREYIANNPQQWEFDRENAAANPQLRADFRRSQGGESWMV